jgi:hypothetical protein
MATGNPFSCPRPKLLFLIIELQHEWWGGWSRGWGCYFGASFAQQSDSSCIRLCPCIIHADTLFRQFLEEFLQPLHVGCEQLRISLCEGFVDR